MTIGLLIDWIIYSYQHEIWRGVVKAARQHGVRLVCFVGDTYFTPSNSEVPFTFPANEMYKLATPETVDGLLNLSTTSDFYEGEFEQFCELYQSLPMVTIGRIVKGTPGVIFDNKAGIHAAIQHLVEHHQCRRIAFICGLGDNFDAQQRYEAYIEGLKEFGLPVRTELIAPGEFNIESGREAVRILLDERRARFDAIIAVDDETALGALDALRARNLQVPDDVRLIGFDDIDEAAAITPPLTTIRQPLTQLSLKGMELLLAILNGERVPERTVLPAELVIRQSCGCFSPLILDSASGPIETDGHSLSTLPVSQKALLFKEVEAILGRNPNFSTKDAEKLVESFWAEIQTPGAGIFLRQFNRFLKQILELGGDLSELHKSITRLRCALLPYFETREELTQAEGLWHQARVLTSEAINRVHAYTYMQIKKRFWQLGTIGTELITTFNVPKLMDALSESVAKIGIPGIYLSLYDPAEPPFELSRLIFAYHDGIRVPLSSQGKRFRSVELIPPGIRPLHREHPLLVEALYFDDRQLGFILFEVGPDDGMIYETLRVEISSALQGALLLEEREQAKCRLEQAYAEISELNERLKVENLRMSAELNVARQLQNMVLPSESELQNVQDLSIAGFMFPADEVGGDYYDVLHSGTGVNFGIGDVTGHGLESGVLMLMTQTAIRTLLDHGETDPVRFLTSLNHTLYHNIQRMEVDKSLTLAMINYHEGKLHIVGQHEEIIVVRKDGAIELVDTVNLGFPLGLAEDISPFISEKNIRIEPGEGLVLYTDGITEAQSADNKFYGLKRLCQVISRYWEEPVDNIKQAVIDDVRNFIGEQRIFDDLTLVVMKRK